MIQQNIRCYTLFQCLQYQTLQSCIMGNECPECQTPTNECKMRDILKQQPKNRQDLNLQTIKKGEYKRKARLSKIDDSDNDIPQFMIQSVVVDRSNSSKKVQRHPSIKRTKTQLGASITQSIKKPLSLDPQTQTLDIKKGLKYIGGTIDGQPHEKGKLIWEDGTTMLAQFFLGQLADNEKVYLKTPDEVSYQGQVHKMKAHSKGKLFLPDGSSYQGQWQADVPHGQGKHKMSDGSFYQGSFSSGLKHGKGKYYFDGGMYQGHFKNDQLSGEGILILNDGRTIRGIWQNGVLEGRAVIQWNSGERYQGMTRKNVREGEGVYWFGDGRKWTGEWENDMQNGFGSYQYRDGEVLKGIWVKGVKKDEMRQIDTNSRFKAVMQIQ